MSGRVWHAQLYTGLLLVCPVLFLAMAVNVGWTIIYFSVTRARIDLKDRNQRFLLKQVDLQKV
jgi:hypothetical protein